MKLLNFFLLLLIFTSITLFSQTIVWEIETKDTISIKTFDSLMSVSTSYSFISDENQLVLLGYIRTGNIFKPLSLNMYPFIRVFNSSTGQMVKGEVFGNSHEYIKKTIDTTYNFVGDSLDSASIYDEKNWIMEIDTTFDTLNLTVQSPIKTIKVGKEYWFICLNQFFLNQFCAPVPYLVRMDEEFNIIEKIDKVNQENMLDTDPLSLINTDDPIFYDENTKRFIRFAQRANSLIIKQFDTSFNYIDQAVNVLDTVPISDLYLKNSGTPKLKAEKLDNGNYIIWYFNNYMDSKAQYFYRTVLHRLYDSDLNLIMERRRVRDDQIGYMDSGILRTPQKIMKNPDTGGYFVYDYSNTGILLEEYTSNGDSVRTLYFDVCDVFPECNITNQVLYKDGRYIYIGLRRETENDMAESTYYTVYLVEIDDVGNIIWQYKVPNITYTGVRPEVILGKEPNSYYISGVNVIANTDFESYELGYYNYNFIVLKIENNSSVSEDNQFPELMIAPNPAASTFTVDYTLEKSGLLSITITDLLGNQVSEEYNNYVEAGTFTKTINIEDLLPGVYYINILHNGKITVKKIIKN